jgi:hypothetical protein
MINAYAQNLGIQSLELALIGFVRWDLARSDGCPGFGEEHQDDILAQVIAQLDVFVQVGWQCKIGSCLPDIKLHISPPFWLAILPYI